MTSLRSPTTTEEFSSATTTFPICFWIFHEATDAGLFMLLSARCHEASDSAASDQRGPMEQGAFVGLTSSWVTHLNKFHEFHLPGGETVSLYVYTFVH